MDEICSQLWLTDIRTVMTKDVSKYDHVITVCEEDISDLVDCNNYQFELRTATSTATSTEQTYRKFSEAVDTVVQHLSEGDTILTHCHSGTSRSVAVSAAAIAKYRMIEFETALELIQEQRPDADPSELYRSYGRQYLEVNCPAP